MAEDRAIFERNVRALVRHPRVLAALEGVDPYPDAQVSTARSGAPVLSVPDAAGQPCLLHSRYEPEREAERLLPPDLHPLATCLFLGAGLGYAPLALAARPDTGHAIVWVEPDARLFRTVLGRVDLSPVLGRRHTLLLVGGSRADLFRLLHEHTPLLFAAPLKLLAHPPSHALQPEIYQAYREAIHEFTREGAVRLRTAFYLARSTLRNQMENLGAYLASPGLAPLRGVLAGQPALLVSAGPSLRKNLPLLSEAVGKIAIIAVSTALRRLLAYGVVPDFTVLIDYHRVSRRYFEGIDPAHAPAMVCETRAAAEAIGAYAGARLFANDPFLNTFLEGTCADKDALAGGSSVAHAAFHMARHLGADPIVLVGQDLAYPGGLVHVPGTAVQTQVFPQTHRFYSLELQELEYYLTERPRFHKVPAIPGGEVPTDDVFLTYLREFELIFADFSGTVIDATEGGACKQHTEVATLRAVLDRFRDARRPDLVQPVATAQARLPVAELRARAATLLAARCADLAALRTLYRRMLRLLDKIIARNERGQGADRQVIEVQELQAACHRYGATTTLLTNLAQSDLWERKRADRLLDISRLEGVPLQLEQARRDRDFIQGLLNGSEFLHECLAAGVQSLDTTLPAVVEAS